MTLVGVIGALLGLLIFPFAIIDRTRFRVSIFTIAFLVHILAGVVFYVYSLGNLSDSTAYYDDPGGLYTSRGGGFGTPLVAHFVQGLRSLVGGTFLDYFLLFQAFGFFGIAILMRIFEEIHLELKTEQPGYVYALLFLPGLHFWTSSIGKDGAIFAGVCLALWAAMDARRRMVWMALGVLIVLVIRPHIAFVMAAAVTGALVLDRASTALMRGTLIAVSVAGLAISASTIQSTFNLDVTNADSVSDYLASHEEFSDSDATGATGVRGGLAIKAVSLLFRPFFVDAEGAFGLLASMENLIFLIMFGVLAWKFREVIMLARRVTFLRYTLVYGIATATLLTLIYYNVGLGLRQKTMFVPCILILFTVVMAMSRVRSAMHHPELPLPRAMNQMPAGPRSQ